MYPYYAPHWHGFGGKSPGNIPVYYLLEITHEVTPVDPLESAPCLVGQIR